MSANREPWRPLYPFESRWLDRPAGRMHYVDEGRGDPVIMLHGNPAWSFIFRNLILALRGEYRAIAPDHIGCGLSDKPPARDYDYRLASRVEDLDALIGSLGLGGDLTLALHDWGGGIGLAWAARHPGRVRRLILLNTAAFFPPGGKRLPWQLRLARTWPFGDILIRGFNAFARGTLKVGTVRPLPADVRRAYLAPYDSWANRIATLRFVQDIPLRPGDPSYAAIDAAQAGIERLNGVPTFIGWGMRDPVFDRDFLAEWRRRLPGAEVNVFDDAGHFVLEDAGDAIVERIAAFLHAHPLAGGRT